MSEDAPETHDVPPRVATSADAERVVIMGAAGRDFHDFNTTFRGREDVAVVAFTRAPGQNLGETEGDSHRRYPPELAGEHYPNGIPIVPEDDLERVVREADVDTVVFSYSDVSHDDVMRCGSRAMAAGADFRILGPDEMMLDVDVPVLAVDAVRTGCGKSQVTRGLADAAQNRGLDVAVVREPMPYGALAASRVQRFETMADIDAADVTIEEREEYEQHVERNHVVFDGVDYADVFAAAASEADLILWDGGNNELPFARPDAHIVLADPLRPDDTTGYHPGETNLRIADDVLVNKENSADDEAIEHVVQTVRRANPGATIRHADSVVTVDQADRIADARVLVVEDGPTVTHGDASHGAGWVASEKYDAAERIDPRGFATGSLADVFDRYPHLDRVLPAMGYTDEQLDALEATIRNADPDCVVAGTPHDLSRQVDVDAPIVRARYHVDLHVGDFDDLLAAHADALGL